MTSLKILNGYWTLELPYQFDGWKLFNRLRFTTCQDDGGRREKTSKGSDRSRISAIGPMLWQCPELI